MTTHDIVLEWQDGQTEHISVDEDETVLEATRANDLGLPFGCLTGACATCAGRLTVGDLTHQRPPRALKDYQQQQGYALLCIAEPRSDCHIEVGARIQAEMIVTPWK
ncbi:2Fe-2S iron-sulfur cluster-binding protein [Halocatena salina]|uniref:2Fe-2S iron-sulfur cluster-binding protein n=1 Tax=Halocatena salina TaxID=2934340 RepID=A0A8U0A7P1_9EURY|nr:2Fe-2S iron-sulfur cluster-binding protein [Halocatena salina]UPM45014.1 2Fe-2S iron-sulfur cluster-binding protein [Halocatena salina]